MLKELQIRFNFCWKLFEWIRDRYEKTLIDSMSCKYIVLNHPPLSRDKTGFFITSPYPRVLSEKIKPYLKRSILKKLTSYDYKTLYQFLTRETILF